MDVWFVVNDLSLCFVDICFYVGFDIFEFDVDFELNLVSNMIMIIWFCGEDSIQMLSVLLLDGMLVCVIVFILLVIMYLEVGESMCFDWYVLFLYGVV